MATVLWKGGAFPVAQVTTCTVGGTIEADDIFKITIGSKTISVTGGSTTAATCATNIVAAINALSPTLYPEFAEITWATTSGGAFTATGKTAGVPFTLTLATTEANGGAADAQTFTQTATTACTGPNHFDNAENWSTGAVPVDADDVIVEATSWSILYGLSQSSVELTSLTINESFTGTIGLPKNNVGNYPEYRTQFLTIGAATVTIGDGQGSGSGRIKIDFEAEQMATRVLNSGTPSENGLPAIILKGTHASNTLTVTKGSVGVAIFGGETSTLATLKVGYRDNKETDSNVRCGSGVTLSSCTITKTGGILEIASATSSLTQYGGTTTQLAGTLTTGLILGGKYIDKSSGTKTTMSARNGGEIDSSQDLQTKTYTNTNIGKGGVLRDPAKQITFTNAIAFTCSLAESTVDLGNTFSLQRS